MGKFPIVWSHFCFIAFASRFTSSVPVGDAESPQSTPNEAVNRNWADRLSFDGVMGRLIEFRWCYGQFDWVSMVLRQVRSCDPKSDGIPMPDQSPSCPGRIKMVWFCRTFLGMTATRSEGVPMTAMACSHRAMNEIMQRFSCRKVYRWLRWHVHTGRWTK